MQVNKLMVVQAVLFLPLLKDDQDINDLKKNVTFTVALLFIPILSQSMSILINAFSLYYTITIIAKIIYCKQFIAILDIERVVDHLPLMTYGLKLSLEA